MEKDIRDKIAALAAEIELNQISLKNQVIEFDSLGRRKVRPDHNLSAIDRFIKRILINPENGCWEWTGARSKNGYGQFKPKHGKGSQKTSPHVFIYEYFYGPVPDGLEIDHFKCRNHPCANPLHLRAVTHKKNQEVLRKDFCKHGHAMTDDNSYISPQGKRYCKKCRSILVNKSLAKREANDPAFKQSRLDYKRKKSRENTKRKMLT